MDLAGAVFDQQLDQALLAEEPEERCHLLG
jgi:hypothetical protein